MREAASECVYARVLVFVLFCVSAHVCARAFETGVCGCRVLSDPTSVTSVPVRVHVRAGECLCVRLSAPCQHDYHRNGLGPTAVRLAQQAHPVRLDVRCGHCDDDKQQVRTPCRGLAVRVLSVSQWRYGHARVSECFPWALSHHLSCFGNYRRIAGGAIYTSTSFGIHHYPPGSTQPDAFMWWETALFDYQRVLSEWVMYDTISGQPIVHGLLDGPHATSRYHVQAAGSADSSEASDGLVNSWRRVHSLATPLLSTAFESAVGRVGEKGGTRDVGPFASPPLPTV